MSLILVAVYSFVTGACFAAVVITFTGDWRQVRRAKKKRELAARVNLGRLAMREEHSRWLLSNGACR